MSDNFGERFKQPADLRSDTLQETHQSAQTDSVHPEIHVGEVLGGQYEVLIKLGEGGMSAVYLCRHITIGEPVAVKVLHNDRAMSQSNLRRFEPSSCTMSSTVLPGSKSNIQTESSQPDFECSISEFATMAHDCW